MSHMCLRSNSRTYLDNFEASVRVHKCSLVNFLLAMASSSLAATLVKPIRKRRLTSPNDHIMLFVKEWYNEARDSGAQTIHCYKKVCESREGDRTLLSCR